MCREVECFCIVSEDVFLEPIPARIGRETLDETRQKRQLIKAQTDGPLYTVPKGPSVCTSTFWYIVVVFLSVSLAIRAGIAAGKHICESNNNIHKTSSNKYDGYDIREVFY